MCKCTTPGWLLSFKQLLFKTRDILYSGIGKSKKSIAITVFQFQKFFIKLCPEGQRRVLFGSRAQTREMWSLCVTRVVSQVVTSPKPLWTCFVLYSWWAGAALPCLLFSLIPPGDNIQSTMSSPAITLLDLNSDDAKSVTLIVTSPGVSNLLPFPHILFWEIYLIKCRGSWKLTVPMKQQSALFIAQALPSCSKPGCPY